MIVDRMVALFGKDPQFTLNIADKMKHKMLEDLNAVPPRKEEYMSEVGLALFFDRSGGKLTGKMSEVHTHAVTHATSHLTVLHYM